MIRDKYKIYSEISRRRRKKMSNRTKRAEEVRMPEDLKRKIELRQVLANCRNELGCFADSDDDLFRFDTDGIEKTIEKIDREVGRYYITEILEP